MVETQTWRIDAGDRVREVVVACDAHGVRGWSVQCRWAAPGHSTARAAVEAHMVREGWTGMALAPGEPTRAEFAAQLAAVTAERDALRADVDRLTLVGASLGLITGIVRKILGAVDGEATPTAAQRVTRELAVLRAQIAPLVACVDALRAAATAAGWRDADATGETLVAWVRRGGAREGAEAVFAAALRTEGVEARERIRQVAALRGLGWLSVDADECGDEDSVCAAQSIAAKIRGREGGE